MVVYEGAGGPVEMQGQLKLFARISAKGRLVPSWGTGDGMKRRHHATSAVTWTPCVTDSLVDPDFANAGLGSPE